MNKDVKQSKNERQKQVREMFLQNISTTEIANNLGVAPSTVRKDIRQLGIRKDKTFIDSKIIRMHLEGLNHIEIGFEVDLSPRYVGKILKKYGYSREARTEDSLIDANIKYADSKVVLEKIIINGKLYTDITPVFAPR